MKMLRASAFLAGCYFLLVIMLWCCAGPSSETKYIKDGKEYGNVSGSFRGRWWNYYERGLSFLEGEFHAEAIADFKEAIKQRDKDQRMARTYGMHFIDFFPHRELGIAYYEMGDLDKAENELELSISNFSTAKARFYLDRVRKGLIGQMAGKINPPTLSFTFKTDEVWTNHDPIILSGTAEDDNYVAGVSIRGVPLFLEGSQKQVAFTEPLHLPQGVHPIEITARNLAGKTAQHWITIHVDREGPTITVEEVRIAKGRSAQEITIKGFVHDEAGVNNLSINGRTVPISNGVEAFFSYTLGVDTGGLEMVASDSLGNRTSATLNPTSFLVHSGPVLLACAETDVVPCLMAGVADAKDTSPPAIRLTGWAGRQTVFLEKVYIEGQASDENNIVGLTINKTPVLRRKGGFIFFSHMAELEKGENTITIQARDEYGNTVSKAITVIRKIPKALQLSERMSLTSFPFEEKGAVSDAGLSFQDNLIYALVNRNRFRVVERSRLDMILAEQNLSRTKLIDRRTALSLGKLAAAQSVITGSIIETRTGIEVVAWMVDTETSEILASEDVYGEGRGLPAMMSLAEGMAVKFHRQFPLVDGVVINKNSKYIFTDLGQEKIKIQRRLIVYKERPIKDAKTGKAFGFDNEIIGHARVIQVEPEMSKAELKDGQESGIKQMDKVITE